MLLSFFFTGEVVQKYLLKLETDLNQNRTNTSDVFELLWLNIFAGVTMWAKVKMIGKMGVKQEFEICVWFSRKLSVALADKHM